MRERDVELRLSREVKKLGGLSWKFTSPGVSGVPDRFVALPGGAVWLIELKAPGKKPTAMQEHRIQQLRDRGVRVRVLDSYEAIDRWVELQEIGDVA